MIDSIILIVVTNPGFCAYGGPAGTLFYAFSVLFYSRFVFHYKEIFNSLFVCRPFVISGVDFVMPHGVGAALYSNPFQFVFSIDFSRFDLRVE